MQENKESKEDKAVTQSGDALLQSLLIIAKHYGLPASPNSLTSGLPLVEGKLTPSLFVRAAERIEVRARVVERSLEDLHDLMLPVVLLLKNNQAAVLLSLDKKNNRAGIIHADSASSAQDISLDELTSNYTGYAILVRHAHRFDKRVETPYSRWSGHWFWGVISQSWRIYRDVLVASFLINLFVLASPVFIMNVYDRVVPNDAVETLWVMAIGVATVYVFDIILRLIRTYFLDLAGRKADIILSARLYERVLGLKMEARPASVGAFTSNLNEFNSIRDFITSLTITTLIDLPFVVLFLLVIGWIAGPVVLVPVVAIPIILLYSLAIQPSLRDAVQRTFTAGAQKNAQLVESLVGGESVKVLGAEDQLQSKWEQMSGYLAKWGSRSRMLSMSATSVATFVQQIASVAVVLVGVYLITERSITMGGLIAAVILTSRAIAPMGQVAGLATRYYQAKAALGTLNNIMQLPVDRPEDKNFVSRPMLSGDIEFDGVTFSYPNQEVAALNNVSLKIRAGEKVAFIGKVGSGKTTLEKLILGLFDPQQGAVRVDGADVRQLDPADLRRNIGYVPQDLMLFQGTLRDNILMGQGHVTDSALLSASESAGVTQFANLNPKGFDMEVGERGQALSGGQRQHVAIARALVSDPSIIMLDEPTSSMDNSSEEAIKQNLQNIIKNKTLILVTHRASLLQLVDRIVVMDQGRIMADGPKDEVLDALRKGRIHTGKNR